MPEESQEIKRTRACMAEIEDVLNKFDCFILPVVTIISDKVETAIRVFPRKPKAIGEK